MRRPYTDAPSSALRGLLYTDAPRAAPYPPCRPIVANPHHVLRSTLGPGVGSDGGNDPNFFLFDWHILPFYSSLTGKRVYLRVYGAGG
ncbi:hypothetical protein GUJ93_ZPchr0008g12268 [Zizania palustris]|uniref:Uncharacterized protein n=1 Tax=Zizania palustris TaxID=103762 RepID=A0A8J5RK40_ZIZPA|nr:hypothetical protein GUJ93_ZPchr0008g12268 [Zizania palustris]